MKLHPKTQSMSLLQSSHRIITFNVAANIAPTCPIHGTSLPHPCPILAPSTDPALTLSMGTIGYLGCSE